MVPIVIASDTVVVLPLGYEQLTGIGSAKMLQNIPTSAKKALVQVEGNTVRWRDDGTAPTIAVGMRIQMNEEFWYTGRLDALQFIEEAATAKINISYYVDKENV